MPRIYTEYRIHHKSVEDKKAYEKAVYETMVKNGFKDRAEFIRVVSTKTNINVKGINNMNNIKDILKERCKENILAKYKNSEKANSEIEKQCKLIEEMSEEKKICCMRGTHNIGEFANLAEFAKTDFVHYFYSMSENEKEIIFWMK